MRRLERTGRRRDPLLARTPQLGEAPGLLPALQAALGYVPPATVVFLNKQKRAKAEANQAYAERFYVKGRKRRRRKRQPARYLNWCRVHGHPPSCQCVYR